MQLVEELDHARVGLFTRDCVANRILDFFQRFVLDFLGRFFGRRGGSLAGRRRFGVGRRFRGRFFSGAAFPPVSQRRAALGRFFFRRRRLAYELKDGGAARRLGLRRLFGLGRFGFWRFCLRRFGLGFFRLGGLGGLLLGCFLFGGLFLRLLVRRGVLFVGLFSGQFDNPELRLVLFVILADLDFRHLRFELVL